MGRRPATAAAAPLAHQGLGSEGRVAYSGLARWFRRSAQPAGGISPGERRMDRLYRANVIELVKVAARAEEFRLRRCYRILSPLAAAVDELVNLYVVNLLRSYGRGVH